MDFGQAISDERKKAIKQMIAEKGLNIKNKDFTKSEVRIIIDETILSPEDQKIAEMKFIKDMKNIDIYQAMHWESESACYRHIARVSEKLKKTCLMIFI